MSTVFLFLDFDETLSDIRTFAPQYVAQLATLLTAEMGGEVPLWEQAIAAELPLSKARYAQRFSGSDLSGYNEWLAGERACVVAGILGRMGRRPPEHEPAAEFARRLEFDALLGCCAPFEGTEEAMRDLFDAGVRIQMASSQDSQYLLAALLGAGIESYVESKFGPDLIDCAKEGPEFYRRVFAATGVEPGQSIVVDDMAECLRWAVEAGAKAVHARLRGQAPDSGFPVALTRMEQLPRLVRQMTGG